MLDFLKKHAINAAIAVVGVAIGIFAWPAIAALVTGAAFVATAGMVLGGLAHVGIVIGAGCTAVIANRTIKAAWALHQINKNPEYTHTKIMKQDANPNEGHHILTTHKTESEKHALYHVDPKGLLTLVGDHTQATQLKEQLDKQENWSPGKHLQLGPAQHKKLIPAGVFSHSQTGSAAESAPTLER